MSTNDKGGHRACAPTDDSCIGVQMSATVITTRFNADQTASAVTRARRHQLLRRLAELTVEAGMIVRVHAALKIIVSLERSKNRAAMRKAPI